MAQGLVIWMQRLIVQPVRRLFTPAQRSYEGAKHTRRTRGWYAPSTGPNAEIQADLVTLRNRHRSLVRDNPWAKRARDAVVNNVVGAGIVSQWSSPARQRRWRDWWESTECDADGLTNGYGLQALIVRTLVESGEVLVYRRRRFGPRGLVPLQLQIREPDHLDQTRNEALPAGGRITQGVQFDAEERRVGYWLFLDHPGEEAHHTRLLSVFIPASEVLHLYRVERPGQVRGVPWGYGAIQILKQLGDYQDAQLERARQSACFVAFVRDNNPESPGPAAAEGDELGDILKPGVIELLPPGKDIAFANPPPPANDNSFWLNNLRAVAADYGLPYEVLTGDLSQVNFSSARMGWQEFGRNIDAARWQLLKPQLLDPLAAWFLEAESLTLIRPPVVEVPLWTPPARVLVDETREVPALRDKVRAGFMSLPEAIRTMGYDPETLLREQAKFLALVDELGVKLDSDPRNDYAQAEAQAEEADADNTAPGKPTDQEKAND